MNTKTTTSKASKPVNHNDAKAFARKIAKEYGPVNAVRALTQKYPSLNRADVIEIAVGELKMNKHTVSRQFHEARSGRVVIDLKAL